MANNGVTASQVILGVHGGTGVERQQMTPELDKKLRAGLEAALRVGYAVLQKPGATSLDAVEAAVRILEDAPEFNAGKGAVFTADGRNELDASIMEGKDKRAGAVASVTHLRNPVSAARLVMEKSKHVFLIGEGAEKFAKSVGAEWVDPKYFWTQHRWRELKEAQAAEKKKPAKSGKRAERALPPTHQWGTVGAVALDSAGNLAAATSTGGMTNKHFGRIGDSPVIGGGTYADNQGGAVSATGHGEFFIRYAVAHEIVSLAKYKGMAIAAAAEEVVNGQLKKAGGEGAVIALSPQGDFAMAKNCEGLYRGYITRDGQPSVFIYEK